MHKLRKLIHKRKWLRVPTALPILVVLVLSAGYATYRIRTTGAKDSAKLVTAQTASASIPPPITAASIITFINQERVKKSLPPFKENGQLDSAALARAKYMVSNKIYDNTSGNPSNFETQAGYPLSGSQLGSAWDDATNQAVVDSLTTGAYSSFGYSTKYSDIGVAVLPATVDLVETRLVVVYIANPEPTASNSGASQNTTQQLQLEQAANCGDDNLQAQDQWISDYQSAASQQEAYGFAHTPLNDPNWQADEANNTAKLNANLQGEYNALVNGVKTDGCTSTMTPYNPL